MKKKILILMTFVISFFMLTNVYASEKYGDVNADGNVNNADLILILNYLNGEQNAISSERLKYADLNSDQKIDNKDYIILLRHLSNWEGYETLPLNAEAKVYAYGDVNLDGNVNNADLILILNYLNGEQNAISSEGLKYADLNDDKKVDNKDYIILLRHLSNWKGYENLPLNAEAKVYAYGDVNLDGKVDQKDIDALTNYLAGNKDAISEEGLKYADLNSDKKVDNKDLIILIRHLNNWKSYKDLPVSSDKEIYETGDINQDGKVDDKDIKDLKDHLEKEEGTLKDDELNLADINGDGKVDKDDLSELEKIVNPKNENNPKTGDNTLYVIATLSIVTILFGSVAYRKMRQN